MTSHFVYVSNAEDGDIGVHGLDASGALIPLGRVAAGKPVGPLAVSPDRRHLYAAIRSKPWAVHAYAIDAKSGLLHPIGSASLAESLPYICTDRNGRFLLGASYGGNLVSVNPIAADGSVREPSQVIPTGRNAHSIVVDRTNRFVFAPHLGTDQVFQFHFDAKAGELAANTPPVLQLARGTGPRHMRISADNRFAYLLSELTATVTTLAIDAQSGTLSEMASTSSLPPGTTLKPGLPRNAGDPPRDVSNDIWASDLHLTPDGRFLYAAERTSSTLGAFEVDRESGRLTYLSTFPTEKQPRGFAIDPAGRFLVASGEKSDMLSVHAIAENGELSRVGRYPTGRGSNWVEII
jgi:6-phosphogluconolactonase